jgi:CHAT domain-containing protein
MVTEANWVAQQLQTRLESPSPSVFDAIQQLAQTQQAHLAMHGHYNRNNPIASGLTLSSQSTNPIQLPLWTLTQVPVAADLIVLSACQSNLSGQDTEGLLTPIGIGPSLAAAGAKTVVGTLWPCHGLAALCFSYYIYQIMAHDSATPWHLIVAEARQALREMTNDHLETIAEAINMDEGCYDSVEIIIAQSQATQRPFEQFQMWAGFSVLGKNRRLDSNDQS